MGTTGSKAVRTIANSLSFGGSTSAEEEPDGQLVLSRYPGRTALVYKRTG